MTAKLSPRGGAMFVKPSHKPAFTSRYAGPGCVTTAVGRVIGWIRVCYQLPSQALAMLCSTISTKKPLYVDQNIGSATASHKIPVCAYLVTRSGFERFIADAVVSLVRNDKHVPIKLVQDTGAKHFFILESVLPFSADSETGGFVLMKEMEMGLIPVSLVQGTVPVGVCLALPFDGVDMILTNDLWWWCPSHYYLGGWMKAVWVFLMFFQPAP